METIIFKNDTDLPVMISTWADTQTPGLSNYVDRIVKSTEEIILLKEYSLTGEWVVSSLFCNGTDEFKIWKEKGYSLIDYIGKFRINFCFFGNNTWMNSDYFRLDYLNNENKILFTKNDLIMKK